MSEQLKTANIPNSTGHRREHCPYCGDDGWVVVDAGNEPKTDEERAQLSKLRKDNPRVRILIYGEALAPCPYCEQGHANEFSGYYGEEGWWRGREERKAELVPQPANPYLPHGEVRRLMGELADKAGAVVAKKP